MAIDYTRIKRGMVFMYNINPDVDKFNPPKVIGYKGKEYTDHTQYGWRPYVVVSNDIGNAYSPTCNIVPMTTQLDKSELPTHVPITVSGQKMQVLCEAVYTVNSMELVKYEYTLTPETMKLVDEALATQFNLKTSAYNPDVSASLSHIESIIQGIISQKVAEATKSVKANAVDIEDAIMRIGEGLETLFEKSVSTPKEEQIPTPSNVKTVLLDQPTVQLNVDDTKVSVPIAVEGYPNKNERTYNRLIQPNPPIKPQSQVDKFYKRYPQTAPSKATPTKKENPTSRRPSKKWTLESMRAFVADSKILSLTEMMKKYEFDDVNYYHKTKYYVVNRLMKLEGATSDGDNKERETDNR